MSRFKRPPDPAWAERLKAIFATAGDPTPVDPSDWVTQYGYRNRTREQPVFTAGEYEVSATHGFLTAEEITRIVMGRGARKRDYARHLLVGALNAAAYEVWHTPNGENVRHCSITSPEETYVNAVRIELWWQNPGRVTLEEIARHCADVLIREAADGSARQE